MNSITQEIAHLAHHLPHQLLLRLATQLEKAQSNDWGYIRALILSNTPQVRHRTLVSQLLTHWQTEAPIIPPSMIAFALQTAAHTAQKATPTTELIWTGPTTNKALRQTEQALLEVIQAAQRELLLVSFTVYPIATVTQALLDAIERGVRLTICLEAPQSGANKINYDTIEALDPDITKSAQIVIWPLDKRITTPQQKIGTLHAKCAVADTTHLFISSANLTDFAMSRNIELGVLIKGGPLPQQVKAQFESLIQKKILEVFR